MDVKVNAVIPQDTRELLRVMAIEYQTTVQRIVASLLGYGLRNMTPRQIKLSVKLAAEKSPTKQYRRTKPF
jgi:hypothetical protein